MSLRNGFLLLILIITNSFQNLKAQEEKNLYVEYEVSFNLGITIQKEAILISNGSSSFFKTLSNQDREKLTRSEDGSYNIVAKGETEVIYTDLSLNTIFIITSLDNKKFKILDKFQPLNWEIEQGKSKLINGNKVFKATTNFRGRTYIAWYNPAIPVSVGPWKFSGLPGLIVEISDTTNKFHWAVKTIKYPYDLNENISIPDARDFREISFREFIELKTNFRADMEKREMARAPQGTTLMSSKTTRGVELEYEWEN